MILRPSKHANPDRTVLALSVLLVKRLKKRRIEELTSVRQYAKSAVKGGEFLLLNALGFLYLMGLINYHKKTDTIEFTGDHNAL